MGITMPQLNVLPINVLKNIEVVEEAPAFSKPETNDDFSQLIDLHLSGNNKKSNESNGIEKNNTFKQVTDLTSAKQQQGENIEQQREGLDENSLTNAEIISEKNTRNTVDSAQQEVAASGKGSQTLVNHSDNATAALSAELVSDSIADVNSEPNTGFSAKLNAKVSSELKSQLSAKLQAELSPEQLMLYLQQADNTLTVPSSQLLTQETSQVVPLSEQQQALYEAKLLMNSSELVADLSDVAKALTNDALTNEVPAEVSKINSLNTAEQAKNSATNNANMASEQAKNALRQTHTEMVIEAEAGEAKLTAEQALVKDAISANKASQQGINTANSQLPETASSPASVPSTTNKTAVETERLAQQMSATTEQFAELESAEQASKQSDKMIVDLASQFKEATASFQNKIAELVQGNKTAGLATEQSELTDIKLSLEKAQLDQVSELDTANTELLSHQMANKTAQTEQEHANKAKLSNGAEQTVPNKSGTVGSDINNKTHQQHAATLAGQAVDEQIQQIDTESLSIKAEKVTLEEQLVAAKTSGKTLDKVDEKPLKVANSNLSANTGFTDVSANATEVAQHAYEQQSSEVLNTAVSSEVAQSQKANVQLHQETIAIFRKDFTEAVKDKVMLMISQKLQQFDITLDPPELGNMQVRVNLQNEQAAVSFIVQNQQAKEALEQNMHKLRDMLAQQGVDVGDANIEQQSQQSNNEDGARAGQQHQGSDFSQTNDMVEHTLSAKVINNSANAVDYYA